MYLKIQLPVIEQLDRRVVSSGFGLENRPEEEEIYSPRPGESADSKPLVLGKLRWLAEITAHLGPPVERIE